MPRSVSLMFSVGMGQPGAVPTVGTKPTHPYSDSEASRHSMRVRLKKIATTRAERWVYLIEDELKVKPTRASPPRHGQSIAPIVGGEASDVDGASKSILECSFPQATSLVCIDQNESRKMSLSYPSSARNQSVGQDLQSYQRIISAKWVKWVNGIDIGVKVCSN